MASEKQVQANRANAEKSTGPRSQAGKDRSRLNSRKHGLTAKMLIIVGEHADDFDQLRAELMAEYDPQSALECELVERLAGILWRLRRVPFFEAAIMDARHTQAGQFQMASIYRASAEREEEDEEETDWQASVHFGFAQEDKQRHAQAERRAGANTHDDISQSHLISYANIPVLCSDEFCRKNARRKPARDRSEGGDG
jgi:hypothetical protein